MDKTALKLPPGLIIWLGLASLFFSCSSNKTAIIQMLSKESYCAPPNSPDFISVSGSMNKDSILAVNTQLLGTYSDPSILIMDALRIDDEVRAIERLKKDTSLLARIELITIKQKIDNKFLLVSSEIDAVAAELDCEGERIEQIAGYINEINSSSTTTLTVASIILGSLSGMAGVFILDSGWDKGVAIGSAIAGTALGFAVLSPKGKKVQLSHDRNLLRNVWTKENRGEINPFIWYMLNEKSFSNSGASSLLDNLQERWIMYQFEGNRVSAENSVNFSRGGTYRASDLYARAQMLNQLQAVVRSISQNLNTFYVELDRIDIE